MVHFLVRSSLAGLLMLGLGSAASAEETVVVNMDQAKVMHISAPAATVIIGNPSIADATIQDRQTLVVTGRGYGTTNFIVLDEKGEAIADAQVRVEAPDKDVVTIFRHNAAGRSTYSCGDICQPMINVGDDPGSYGIVLDQTKSRNSNAATRGGVQ